MSSKYQVFVSSTYTDLKEQRDQIIKAILEMGHIPVGMEMFSAADEEQWNIIKRQIDQSDYYVIIAANRYGSVTSDGISYTEKEYDYAVSAGIPILGFILDQTSSWPSNFTDTEPGSVASLSAFKEKIKKKHVSFWKNTDDLYGKCSIALMKAFTAYPREGWVRASMVSDAKASAELARLSAENAALRSELNKLKESSSEKHDRELKELVDIMSINKRQMYIWMDGANDWEKREEIDLFELFITLGTELMVEASVEHLSRYAAQMVCKLNPGEFRHEFPVPNNLIKSWLADWAALGLTAPSDRKKAVNDANEYWKLTEKGIGFVKAIRKIQLESGKTKSELPEKEEISA
jgi:hypothetical protein